MNKKYHHGRTLIRLTVLFLALFTACLALSPASYASAAAEEEVPSLEQAVFGAIPGSEEMTVYDEDEMYDIVGIPPEDHTEFVYLTGENDIGLVAREIIIVRAVDQAALDRAVQTLDHYLARRKTETRSYAPDIYQLLEKASVQTKGLTAVLIISENGAEEASAFLAGE